MTTFSPPGKKSCQRERPCRKAAHERHEEKDGCPYFEDACPFLRIHRPQRCGAASPGPSPSGGKKWRLRFRRGFVENRVLLRGAPGSARPTRGMRIRLTGNFGFVLLRGTPGTAFPTGRVRIRRTWCLALAAAAGRRGRRPLQGSPDVVLVFDVAVRRAAQQCPRFFVCIFQLFSFLLRAILLLETNRFQ